MEIKSVTFSWLTDTSEGFSYTEFSTLEVGKDNITKLIYVEPNINLGNRDHYIDVYKDGKLISREFNIDGILF